MGVEIERKFLVDEEKLDLSKAVQATHLQQGYLCDEPVVRVRTSDQHAWITIKAMRIGITRSEFEYPIPVRDAREMLLLCGAHVLEKTRYVIQHNDAEWEVDVFHGANEGLIVAEIELDSEGEAVDLPEWVRLEVTDDPRYANSCLVREPWRNWGPDQQ